MAYRLLPLNSIHLINFGRRMPFRVGQLIDPSENYRPSGEAEN